LIFTSVILGSYSHSNPSHIGRSCCWTCWGNPIRNVVTVLHYYE